MDYSAKSEKGDCRLGGAGFRASDVDDVKDSVVQGVRMWAKAVARKQGSPHSSIGSPQRMKTKSGGWVERITARVTMAPDKDNCGSTGTTIHLLGLPVKGRWWRARLWTTRAKRRVMRHGTEHRGRFG